MSKNGQDTIRQMVTDRVVAALEKGTAPWHKAWATTGTGLPRNFDGRYYRGVNVIILASAGYSSPFWGTINHKGTGSITQAGGHVREGEHPEMIVFFKRYVNVSKTEVDEHGKPLKKISFTLRYFNVFNAEQCDGLPAKYYPATTEAEAAPEHPEAAIVAKEYFARDGAPSLGYGGDKANFGWTTDHIQLPPQASFDSDPEFQATRFHEMAHSTGHKKRLNRPQAVEFDHFGSDKYGKEELVAEMTTCMLLAVTNLDSPFDNSAAYINSWINAIKGDTSLVISAGAQAQHAMDNILGVTYKDDE